MHAAVAAPAPRPWGAAPSLPSTKNSCASVSGSSTAKSRPAPNSLFMRNRREPGRTRRGFAHDVLHRGWASHPSQAVRRGGPGSVTRHPPTRDGAPRSPVSAGRGGAAWIPLLVLLLVDVARREAPGQVGLGRVHGVAVRRPPHPRRRPKMPNTRKMNAGRRTGSRRTGRTGTTRSRRSRGRGARTGTGRGCVTVVIGRSLRWSGACAAPPMLRRPARRESPGGRLLPHSPGGTPAAPRVGRRGSGPSTAVTT